MLKVEEFCISKTATVLETLKKHGSKAPVMLAPSHGLPAILYDEESIGSINHLSLAREIISKNSRPEVHG